MRKPENIPRGHHRTPSASKARFSSEPGAGSNTRNTENRPATGVARQPRENTGSADATPPADIVCGRCSSVAPSALFWRNVSEGAAPIPAAPTSGRQRSLQCRRSGAPAHWTGGRLGVRAIRKIWCLPASLSFRDASQLAIKPVFPTKFPKSTLQFLYNRQWRYRLTV